MAADRFSFASVETRTLFDLSRFRTLSYTSVSFPHRRISSKFPGYWIRVSCSYTQRRRFVACLISKQTQASVPADSSASSSSSPEFDLVSTKECSDGSTVFLFGDVSETANLDIKEAEANDGSLNEVASEDFPDEGSTDVRAREVPDEDEAEINEVAIKSLSSSDIIGSEVVDYEEIAVPRYSPPNPRIIDEGKENSDEATAAKSLSSEDKLELQSLEKKCQEETAVSVSGIEIASRPLTSDGLDICLALEAEDQEKGEVTEPAAETLSGSDTGTSSTEDVTANVDSDHTAELEEVTHSGSNIDVRSESNKVLDTELLDSSSLGLEAISESPESSTPLDVSPSSTFWEERLNLGTEEITVLEEETPLEDLTVSYTNAPKEAASEEEVLQATKAVDIIDSINSENLLQSDSPAEGDKTAIIDETSAEEEVLWATVSVDITDSTNSEELLRSNSPYEGDTTAIVKDTSAEEEVLQVKIVDLTDPVNLEELSGSETLDDDNTTAIIDEVSQEKDWDEAIGTGSEVEITLINVKEVIEDLSVASAVDEHSADTSISENSEKPEKLHPVADGSEKTERISNVNTESNVEVAENVTEVIDLPTAPAMNEDSVESADTSIETSITENCEEPEKLHAEYGGEEVKEITVASSLDTDTTESPSVLDNGIISNQEDIEEGEERNDIAEVSSTWLSQSEDVILNSDEEIIPIEFSLSSAALSLPRPSKALTGGEDAYFIAGKNWVGVADGAAHWSLRGTIDGLFAKELMKNCKAIVSDSKSCSVTDVLVTSVAETGSVGKSTVLLAHFDGQILSVATVGDSGFIVIRDGTILKRSVPMAYEFNFSVQIGKGDDPSEVAECYRIELYLNDAIIIATDGLFDNLYDQEIASIVHKSLQEGLTPQEMAKVLVKGAEEAARSGSGRSPFSDSAHAAGYVGYSGGKLDDITVIVSVVTPEA